MTRRVLADKNVRKIMKLGASYAVTIPVEMVRKLKWREGQKLVFKKRGTTITIVDWK